MKAIATNPDQSARLIDCGVYSKSADFVWMENKPNDPRLTLRTEIISDDNPYIVALAWSLSALISILPKEIDDECCDMYYLSIAQDMPLTHEYNVSYQPCWYNGEVISRKHDNDLIEACVQMIEWLVANGYVLNEIEDSRKG